MMTNNDKTGRAAAIGEIDVLWITAGLGCDGDTIAITAATQPSLEDVLLGGIPGIPKVNFSRCFNFRSKPSLFQAATRMRNHVYGSEACIIGMVKEQPAGIVAMQTGFGGTRIVDMLVGEQLPRIC